MKATSLRPQLLWGKLQQTPRRRAPLEQWCALLLWGKLQLARSFSSAGATRKLLCRNLGSDQLARSFSSAVPVLQRSGPSGPGSVENASGCGLQSALLRSGFRPTATHSLQVPEVGERAEARNHFGSRQGHAHSLHSRPRQRGGALLAVLWLSAALSAIAFSVANTVRTETERTATSSEGLRTYYLASGSIDRAILWMQWGRNGSPDYYHPPMPYLRFAYPSGVAVVEVS